MALELMGAAVACALVLPGCNALQGLEDGGATVFVFATHHATPVDGVIPHRGDDNMARVFDTDEGWNVTLLEAYVTISAMTLVECNGTPHELDMFWGPCPEDLRDEDLATLTVAGRRVAPGNYCTLSVEYSAYQSPVIDEDADETRHETPANDQVDGATIYLQGGARQSTEDSFINFELATDASVVVDLDLSNIEGPGQPLNVAHREDFPKELLVSKTYDRFLDGLDFAALDQQAAQDDLIDVLADETRVSPGTVVQLDPPPSSEE